MKETDVVAHNLANDLLSEIFGCDDARKLTGGHYTYNLNYLFKDIGTEHPLYRWFGKMIIGDGQFVAQQIDIVNILAACLDEEAK
jgi:hypothetical protein